MKIAEIKAWPLACHLSKPTWTAHESLQTRYAVLVEVKTDDGIAGYGIVNQGPVADVARWVETCAAQIRGMDASGHAVVWDKLFRLTSPRPGAIGNKDVPPPVPRPQRTAFMAAMAGIDIALWDIKGKAAGKPVWALLGGSDAPLKAYVTSGYYQPGKPAEACAPEFGEHVANGYRAVKLKAGAEHLDFEVARLKAVREVIGPDVELMMDLNAAYTLEEGIRAAHAFAEFDVVWLEEPLHWYYQPQDFARLAAHSPIPLAHGERELHRFTTRDFIEHGGIRFVQFDATRAAGFTEALRVAEFAAQKGVLIAPHTVPAIHGHLVAAFPESGYCVESLSGPHSDPIGSYLWADAPKVRDGALKLTDKPGFGLEVDWDFVKGHPA